MFKRAIVAVLTLSTVGLAACSSAGTTASTSDGAAGATMSSAPSSSATPTPSPTALTGDALRASLLTAKDLGAGWKVTKRAFAGTKPKDYEDLSPECTDFMKAWAGAPIKADDPNAAYVEIAKGKDFGQRTVTVRVEPMPEGGFDAYKERMLSMLEECPSLTTSGSGSNSMSATMINTEIPVPGFEGRSVGFLGTVNVMIAQFYFFYGFIPVGDNLVSVSTSWAQKSKKYFGQVTAQAVEKVAQASGVSVEPSPAASASASSTSSASASATASS